MLLDPLKLAMDPLDVITKSPRDLLKILSNGSPGKYNGNGSSYKVPFVNRLDHCAV